MPGIPDTPGFRAATAAARRLSAFGFQTMIVGGAVRDMLLGETPEDLDLVTTATPDELAAVFPGRSRLVGASFGVSLLRLEESELEVATAREERNYLDGRHPESVRYSRDLRLDVVRRDFTINALMYDPLRQQVVDLVDGQADLRRGIVRTVGEPELRFREDYLRMLRAVRFAGRFGFRLADSTRAALDRLSHLAGDLSGERVRTEVSRILCSLRAADSLQLMLDTGLLKAILPEVAALKDVEQPPQFHPEGDVFAHTRLMLKNMVLPGELLGWSVLLHDIGKAPCFSRDDDGRIRFFGHEQRGAEMAENILDRLHFSSSDRESIVSAVRNHMRFASVTEMRPAKLRRLLAERNFGLELELHRLDCLSCHGKMDGFVFLLDQMLRQADPRLPEPLIRGRDLIAAGIVPSPKFGQVLHEIYDLQLAGAFPDQESALKAALKLLDSESAP